MRASTRERNAATNVLLASAGGRYTNVRWWIIARFGVIGLTQLFLILYPNHLEGSMGKARLAFTGMAFVVALLIILYFAFFFNA
jgi:hypothetical protein